VSPFPPEHVNASDLPELEVPSTGEGLRALSFEGSRGALPPLAGDGSRRTCSSTFENLD
jgi:hypothetical protein